MKRERTATIVAGGGTFSKKSEEAQKIEELLGNLGRIGAKNVQGAQWTQLGRQLGRVNGLERKIRQIQSASDRHISHVLALNLHKAHCGSRAGISSTCSHLRVLEKQLSWSYRPASFVCGMSCRALHCCAEYTQPAGYEPKDLFDDLNYGRIASAPGESEKSCIEKHFLQLPALRQIVLQ